MYCINCGKKMEEQDLFCSNCGTKVSVEIRKHVKQEQIQKTSVSSIKYILLLICIAVIVTGICYCAREFLN